jgi:hypothetical protein
MSNAIKKAEAELVILQRRYARTKNEAEKDILAEEIFTAHMEMFHLRRGTEPPRPKVCMALVVYGTFLNPLPIPSNRP